MAEHRFHLGVKFDPQTEDRAILGRWPGEEIVPDLAVVAAGWVVGEFAEGRSYRVGDYVLLFLFRWLDEMEELRDGLEHRIEFADGPGFVALHMMGDRIRCRWCETADSCGPEGQVDMAEFRTMAVAACEEWVAGLLEVNRALADHGEVRRLRDHVIRLLAGGSA
jgi:hypothetical protein